MGGVVKEEDEELFYCLFQFALVLSSCPSGWVLFNVSARERLMGFICTPSSSIVVTWGWYYLSYLRHCCNRNCDPCDGYHCTEVTHRILWALQKLYILIRVSQASQSQLSLLGLHTWRSPGQQRGCHANIERILRVWSQQHVVTRRMSQCLSIPGLEKHAKSTMTRIFQLFCLSGQSPKNIPKKSPK